MLEYDILDDRQNEIRLLRLLPGKADEPVRCALQTVSLESAPAFEALSYVWGDPAEQCPITVNNAAHNVPLMAQVYKTAKDVLVWLGPATNNISLALGWLQAYTASGLWAGGWSVLVAAARWIWLDVKAFFSLRAQQERLLKTVQAETGSFELMSHTYWTRMWTFQEFCLPRTEPTCCCGDSLRFRIAALFENVAQLHKMGSVAAQKISEIQIRFVERQISLLEDRKDQGDNIEGSLKADMMKDVQLVLQVMAVLESRRRAAELSLNTNAGTISSLRSTVSFSSHLFLPLLRYTIERQSGNPRDKIYALYGLAPELQATYPPDYNRLLSTVMCETAVFLLHQDDGKGTWGFFSTRRDHLADSTYPSWVPDFTTKSRLAYNLHMSPSLSNWSGVPAIHFLADFTAVRFSARRVGRCRVLQRFAGDRPAVLQLLRDLLCQEPVNVPRTAGLRAHVAWTCMGVSLPEDWTKQTPAAVEEALDALLAGTADENDRCVSIVSNAVDNLAGMAIFASADPAMSSTLTSCAKRLSLTQFQ